MRVVRVGGRARRGARGGAPRGAGRVRRRPRLPRALPRAAAARRDPAARRRARHRPLARRARLLGAAPPPEGARGVAVARARRRTCARAMSDAAVRFATRDRLRRRRHRRVRGRRPRLLLPRAERPHPGRASGDRGGHRHRPRAVAAAHRARRGARRPPRSRAATRSRCGSTPRTRARSCRRPAASSGCGSRAPSASTPGSPRATRSAPRYDPMIAKLIASGATRDEALDRLAAALAETEVTGRDDEPAVPALARRASRRCARATTTTAFLTEYPPLSAPPARAARAESGAAASGSTSHRPHRSRRPTSTQLHTLTAAPRAVTNS